MYRNGAFAALPWREVAVGEFVKIVNNDSFPADLLLIASSDSSGLGYIETASLDGFDRIPLILIRQRNES